MPIHDFKCVACGISFEVIVLASDTTFICPGCESNFTQRMTKPGIFRTLRTGNENTLKPRKTNLKANIVNETQIPTD